MQESHGEMDESTSGKPAAVGLNTRPTTGIKASKQKNIPEVKSQTSKIIYVFVCLRCAFCAFICVLGGIYSSSPPGGAPSLQRGLIVFDVFRLIKLPSFPQVEPAPNVVSPTKKKIKPSSLKDVFETLTAGSFRS